MIGPRLGEDKRVPNPAREAVFAATLEDELHAPGIISAEKRGRLKKSGRGGEAGEGIQIRSIFVLPVKRLDSETRALPQPLINREQEMRRRKRQAAKSEERCSV